MTSDAARRAGVTERELVIVDIVDERPSDGVGIERPSGSFMVVEGLDDEDGLAMVNSALTIGKFWFRQESGGCVT
jgi:hypothetical protein